MPADSHGLRYMPIQCATENPRWSPLRQYRSLNRGTTPIFHAPRSTVISLSYRQRDSAVIFRSKCLTSLLRKVLLREVSGFSGSLQRVLLLAERRRSPHSHATMPTKSPTGRRGSHWGYMTAGCRCR